MTILFLKTAPSGGMEEIYEQLSNTNLFYNYKKYLGKENLWQQRRQEFI